MAAFKSPFILNIQFILMGSVQSISEKEFYIDRIQLNPRQTQNMSNFWWSTKSDRSESERFWLLLHRKAKYSNNVP
jgi:hypothetical protein